MTSHYTKQRYFMLHSSTFQTLKCRKIACKHSRVYELSSVKISSVKVTDNACVTDKVTVKIICHQYLSPHNGETIMLLSATVID